MFTTLRIRFPVNPFHPPFRTQLEKSANRSRTAWTRGTTFWPSTTTDASLNGAQCSMQDRAIFGAIDLLSAEHGMAETEPRRVYPVTQGNENTTSDWLPGLLRAPALPPPLAAMMATYCLPFFPWYVIGTAVAV